MITRRNKSFICYAIILIICFFAFFVNSNIIPADLMESRNLATAQEMVKNGNYLMPTLNGELRLEKPPLPTWIAACVEHYTPYNLVAQRAMAGLAATALIIFLFLLVSRLTRSRRIGLMSALVCATSFNILLIGRTASWDIYCHSFMLGAIYFLVMAIEKQGAQWKRFMLAGVFMGLSFLSKGPVSFYALLLPFLIGYFAVFNVSFKKKLFPIITMILICLAISFWWPIYIMSFHKEFALSIVDKEADSWTSRNVRPFFYYWKFSAEAGIWTLFWITSIVYFFCKRKNEDQRALYALSIIWTFASLVLLSVIPEKKTRYLLPMLIPGAINIAFYFYYSAKSKMTDGEGLIFKINTMLIAVVMLVCPIVLYIKFVEEDLLSVPVFLITAVLCIGIGASMLYAVFNKRGIKVMNVYRYIVYSMVVAACFFMAPVGNMFINQDRHSIQYLRGNKNVQGLPFFHNEDDFLRMELVYESNEVIRSMDLKNNDLIKKNLPFVLISVAPTDLLMAGKNVTVQHVDTFDNNWRKQDHKRYNKNLVSYVSIIREKNNLTNMQQDSIIVE